MLFTSKTNAQEAIIYTLQKGSMPGNEIVKHAREYRPGLTKQAVYAALRSLIAEEVVHRWEGVYVLSRLWMDRMQGFLYEALFQDALVNHSFVRNMEDGDHARFTFKNAQQANAYWAHSFNYVFNQTMDDPNPVIVCHPHEWLVLDRPEQEAHFLRSFDVAKRKVYFAIGGATTLDREFKKRWGSPFRHINVGTPYSFSQQEYVNIIGDYIFTVRTGSGFSEELQVFYGQHTEVNTEMLRDLRTLAEQRYVTKIEIRRDHIRAEKLRKRISRDFV